MIRIDPNESYIITFDYYGDDVRTLPFHPGELHEVIPQSIDTPEGTVEDAYATIVGGAGGWEMPEVMEALLQNEEIGDSITVMDWERNIIIDDDWDAVREIATAAANPNVLTGYHIGDFIEFFGEDAKVLNEVAGVTLTRSTMPKYRGEILAGYPAHAASAYIRALEDAGYELVIKKGFPKDR